MITCPRPSIILQYNSIPTFVLAAIGVRSVISPDKARPNPNGHFPPTLETTQPPVKDRKLSFVVAMNISQIYCGYFS